MPELVAVRVRAARTRSVIAGFSLIEVVIGVFFLASMMLAAGFAVDRAAWMLRQRRAEEELATRAGRLAARAARELAFARRATLVPDPGGPFGTESLRFQQSAGVEAGIPQWSGERALGFELAPGELDDGLDNDGDGLVDQGELVWTTDSGGAQERRVVWGRGLCERFPGEELDGEDDNGNGLVDERGLSFSAAGDVLTIRVALQEVGPRGNLMTKIAETSTFMRN
jgi:hypothetical protein